MADILGIFGTDQAREDGGVWTDLKLGLDSRFLIGGVGSRIFQAESFKMSRIVRLQRERANGQSAPEDPMEGVERLCRLYARTIFLGFKNVEVDGKPLEDTEDNRTLLLKRSPRLRQIIEDFAGELAPYRLEHDEAGLGNSARPSPGDEGREKTSDGSGDSSRPAV